MEEKGRVNLAGEFVVGIRVPIRHLYTLLGNGRGSSFATNKILMKYLREIYLFDRLERKDS